MILKKINSLNLLFNIYKHLSLRRKIFFLIFFVLTSVSAFFDIISIGLVIPFMNLMINPDELLNYFSHSSFFTSIFFLEKKYSLTIITSIFILSIFVATIFRILVFNLNQKISLLVSYEFNIILYKKILNFQFSKSKKKIIEESEVLSTIEKTDNISNYINNFLNFCSGFLISFFISCTLLIYLDSKIIFIIFSFIIFYILIIFIVKKKLNHNSSMISDNIFNKNLHIKNTLGLFKEIILNNLEYFFFNKFKKINYKLVQSAISNNIIATIPGIILVNFTIVIFAIVIYNLSYNNNSILEHIPFLSALVFGVQKCIPLFYQMYSSLTRMNGGFYQANTAMNQINSLTGDKKKKDFFVSDDKKNLTFNNHVKFNRITFRYNEDQKYIIQNLNFNFNKGEKILFQGNSGSGKTTLINIILGFLKPSSGSIKIDNKKVSFQKYRKFVSSISYCPQSIFLIKDNFINNISLIFNKDLIDNKKVIFCAKIACIHKKIITNKNDYHSEIYQDAKNLSGGQIQRIGIARTLYKKSQVIIFDESTNSIDSKTELKILKNIFKYYKDKTIIFISHKKYPKSFFDKVYIFKNKKLSLI